MSTADDRGQTLVEVLVAVVILGLAVTALLGLMGVDVAGSDRHQADAVATTLLFNGAQRAKAGEFEPCRPVTETFDRYTLTVAFPGPCSPADPLTTVRLAVARGGEARLRTLDVVVRRAQ